MSTIAPFNSPLQAIYLIASDVVLLQQEARAALLKAARQQGFNEREIYSVETGFNWLDFFVQAQNYNLFSAKTLIEVHNPQAKFDEKAIEGLENYLAHPPQDKILLILTGKLTAAQQKTRWYKAIEKKGVCLQIRPISKSELPRWIAERSRQLKLTLDRASIALLTELTEGNLLATQQALVKLTLLYPHQPVDPAKILHVINDNSRFNVFDLGNLILAGHTKQALRTLHGLKNTGTELTQILWAIVREIRELAELGFKQQQGIPLTELLQRHWQQRRPLLKQALARLPLAKLNELLLEAERADRTIKGIHPGDAWDNMETLILKMTRAP